MAAPKLRVRASGMGGSGYSLPTRKLENGKNLIVPGVTTALGALDKSGVLDWHIANTVAFAVAKASEIAERDPDWGFKYLRYYTRRKLDYDDPGLDLHGYSTGVLNDLANQGTLIHEGVEAFIKQDHFGFPEWTRPEQAEAFETFLDWQETNDVEFLASEATVFNPEAGYAGTGDVWMRYQDRLLLTDVKSARQVHDSHICQGAALMKAPVRMVEDPSGVEYVDSQKKVTYWKEEEAMEADGIAVLQVRQRSIDEYGNEIPAFCKLTVVPDEEIEPAYQQFLGALQVRKAQAKLRTVRNEAKNREKEKAVEYC